MLNFKPNRFDQIMLGAAATTGAALLLAISVQAPTMMIAWFGGIFAVLILLYVLEV